jgi:hypothetical protein
MLDVSFVQMPLTQELERALEQEQEQEKKQEQEQELTLVQTRMQ